MDIVDLLLRWVHVLAAVAAAGGIVFWRFVLVPAVYSLDETDRQRVLEAVRGRWARVVMLATLLLLVTGIVNAVRMIQTYELDRTYHLLVMVKLVLAMVFFYLVARLSGRSEAAVRFRQRLPFWMSVACALVVALVLIAGYMKSMSHTPKPVDAVARVTQLDLSPATG